MLLRDILIQLRDIEISRKLSKETLKKAVVNNEVDIIGELGEYINNLSKTDKEKLIILI